MTSPENNEVQNTTSKGSVSRKLSSVMLPMCPGDEVARKSTDYQNREASKTFTRPDRQDNQVREPYELRSLSKKPVLDTLPATQQPQIPIKQIHYNKTCTLLFKDDVDWDEDLRPSDDNNPGGAGKETVTPMPLLFSGSTSFLHRSCDAPPRTEKPVKRSRAPGKTGAKVRTHKKSTGLPSQSPTRTNETWGESLDCVDDHVKQMSGENSESRAQAYRAMGFCGKPTIRDQNSFTAADEYGFEHTDTSQTKQRKAVYGAEPGIRSEHQSSGGTTPLCTDGNGQEGRGKEVGKKLAAALKKVESQPKYKNQDWKPTNRDDSNQNSSKNQGASNSVMMPETISPLGSTPATAEKATQFNMTGSSMESQWEDSLQPHVGLPAEQQSDSIRDIDDEKQLRMTDQVNRSDPCVDFSSKSAQTGMENFAHPDLSLDIDQKPSESFLACPSPSPRKLIVDKNGSPLVIHLRKRDRAPLRGGFSQSEGGKQAFFSYRPQESESGYEGGSESDIHGEISSSPDLATCPNVSSKTFLPHGFQRAPDELSRIPDGPSVQRSAQANASLERSVGEASDNITRCDIYRSTQKILLASTQHLAFQLEDERKSIDKILETYDQQCHLMLDQLFKAQEERIKLCKQQMASIQIQHANIRQGLIDRLKAGEKHMMTRKRARSNLLRGQDPGPLGRPEKGRKRRNDNGTADHG